MDEPEDLPIRQAQIAIPNLLQYLHRDALKALGETSQSFKTAIANELTANLTWKYKIENLIGYSLSNRQILWAHVAFLLSTEPEKLFYEKDPEYISLAIEIKLSPNFLGDALEYACTINHTEAASKILELNFKGYILTEQFMNAAIECAKNNNLSLLKDVVNADFLDYSFDDNALLGYSLSPDGWNDVSLFLIKDEEVLNSDMVFPMFEASKHGSKEQVAYFISNQKVDPNLDDLIYNSIIYLSDGVIDTILSNKRTMHKGYNGEESRAVLLSIELGKASLLATLVKDGRLSLKKSLKRAIKTGRVDIVKILLDSGRINPTMADYKASETRLFIHTMIAEYKK